MTWKNYSNRSQQQKWIVKVVKLQVEAEEVTGIIQLVHEKVRQVVQLVGLTTLEHINFELVKKLEKAEAEVP